MLRTLSIRDFGLVDKIDLEFAAGLTCITGETGAGKSLLVNALAFVLGDRAQTEWIRTGSETCEVSAVFETAGPGPAGALLDELGIPAGEPVIVRRDFGRTGRGRVFVSDRPVTVQSLKRLGQFLCDLHGQHEHQWLLDPASHRHYLDRFVDPDVLGRYQDAFDDYSKRRLALEELREHIARANSEKEFWAFQLKELDQVDPRPGEYEELAARRDRIRHRAELTEAYLLAEAEIDAADESLAPRLHRLAGELRRRASLDPDLASWAARLDEARTQIGDVAREAGSRLAEADGEPAELEALEARLHRLYKLKQRFGGSLEAAIVERDALRTRLAGVEHSDAELGALAREVEKARAALDRSADELRQARRRGAEELARALRKPLAELGLGKDPVRIAERPLEPEAWQISGPDEIEFLLAANPREEPRPLARIASGGELSRVMLALKAVLPGQDRVETLVFDEVDSGIGAVTGARVGEMLKALGSGRQVIVITHLHSVAALADHHWVVTKQAKRGRNVPTVTMLSAAERIEELGRLIAGGEATRESRAAARALVRPRGSN
jgi:DNA repair protein RecN (Recombination protein N)